MQNLLDLYRAPEVNSIIKSGGSVKQKLSPEELRNVRLINLNKSKKSVNQQQTYAQPNINAVQPSEFKKKRKSKSEINNSWTRAHKFFCIDPPTVCANGKYKYQVVFKYTDPNDGKVKKKTIRFGRKDKEYLVDHQDDQKNKKMLSNMKAYYCPFHKNFWVVHLLCQDISINKAYTKLLNGVL
jgi:hypothetical protein